MHKILVAGAGRIGSLITTLLSQSGDYYIYLIDVNTENSIINKIQDSLQNVSLVQLDVTNQAKLLNFAKEKQVKAVISCLPYYCNVSLAELARSLNINYFDPTEDMQVTEAVKHIAESAHSAFVPQCGLAPGVVGIIADDLMQQFDEIDNIKMRVGALPEHASNTLKYALTWSTDGLINEYGNPCQAVVDGQAMLVKPLGDLETIELDGNTYEAFNTSGGLGSLVELYEGKVRNMNYKTIRYPGHCEKMRFLMRDLKLNNHRDILKKILENSIPKTLQDVVVIYVSVTGKKKGELQEAQYMNKVYPQEVVGQTWSAIQITTASSICVVVDIVMNNPARYQGFVYQEKISFKEFLANRFANFYAKKDKKQ
ncbi:MAG: saccharopine dehydrogenase [Gammaproteobacteria bacterium RIFCSPHIGHO2_12_FULL_35_23]|nr:MAG: saccharopine dehydrogenase [Gammaproteobacteria bacterium RIFCSPHIGHO2_12_FULL_35_23]